MSKRCVEVCPLPSNATEPVKVIDLKKSTLLFVEPINESRRYRTFPINGINDATHETSVLVDSKIRDGVQVNPEARACSDMMDRFQYRKLGGATGGTIRCPFTNLCGWSSGSATRNTK